MKVGKEFKSEFDAEFANASYAGRKLLTKTVIVIIILSVLCAVCGVGYKMWKVNTDRQIFKASATYNEGKLDDLAKYRLEMSKAEDDTEKAAIAEYVNSVYANYDESKIENDDLRVFLLECRNGNY